MSTVDKKLTGTSPILERSFCISRVPVENQYFLSRQEMFRNCKQFQGQNYVRKSCDVKTIKCGNEADFFWDENNSASLEWEWSSEINSNYPDYSCQTYMSGGALPSWNIFHAPWAGISTFNPRLTYLSWIEFHRLTFKRNEIVSKYKQNMEMISPKSSLPANGEMESGQCLTIDCLLCEEPSLRKKTVVLTTSFYFRNTIKSY